METTEKLQKILHLFVEKEKNLVNQMEAADKSEADRLWNESVIWFQAAKIVNNEITAPVIVDTHYSVEK